MYRIAKITSCQAIVTDQIDCFPVLQKSVLCQQRNICICTFFPLPYSSVPRDNLFPSQIVCFTDLLSIWWQLVCRLEKEKAKQARQGDKSNHKQTKMDSFLKASKGVMPPTAKGGEPSNSPSRQQVSSLHFWNLPEITVLTFDQSRFDVLRRVCMG